MRWHVVRYRHHTRGGRSKTDRANGKALQQQSITAETAVVRRTKLTGASGVGFEHRTSNLHHQKLSCVSVEAIGLPAGSRIVPLCNLHCACQASHGLHQASVEAVVASILALPSAYTTVIASILPWSRSLYTIVTFSLSNGHTASIQQPYCHSIKRSSDLYTIAIYLFATVTLPLYNGHVATLYNGYNTFLQP